MRILVTGGGGFIGRSFIRQAVEAGHQLALLARSRSAAPAGQMVIKGDLRSDLRSVVREFAPEACVHLAWTTTPGKYLTSEENSVLEQATLMFARRLYESGVPHFVAAGTCLEYESAETALAEDAPASRHPVPYTAAKLSVRRHLEENFPSSFWSWLRVFYPYGPGDNPGRLPGQLLRSCQTGIPVELKRPFDVVDYIHVDDVAAAFLLAVERKLSGDYNVAGGTPVVLGEFASRLAQTWGCPAPVFAPDGERSSRFADIAKLRSCGWAPSREMNTSLEEFFPS
jgi:dTDP-6-deoxy-L-talose 4-dehydrogenase (NAD+)